MRIETGDGGNSGESHLSMGAEGARFKNRISQAKGQKHKQFDS